jgi:MSHA biogenesis protein MshK
VCRQAAFLALVLSLLSAPVVRAQEPALADPTRPPDAFDAVPLEPDVEPGDAAPLVTSILVSPERQIAVIDGQRVEPGDSFEGARVVAITPRGVRLDGPDGDIVLGLALSSVKAPSASREEGGR